MSCSRSHHGDLKGHVTPAGAINGLPGPLLPGPLSDREPGVGTLEFRPWETVQMSPGLRGIVRSLHGGRFTDTCSGQAPAASGTQGDGSRPRQSRSPGERQTRERRTRSERGSTPGCR